MNRWLPLALVAPLYAGCQEQSPDWGTDRSGLSGDGLVISAVYGGGGQAGATFRRDFVELFNRSEAPIPLNGLSLQYGSANGVFGASPANVVQLPRTSTVPPGGYFLLAFGSNGSNGQLLPTPDVDHFIDMAASSGKFALARRTTSLACGSSGNRCTDPDIIDLVGYGNATDFEGAAAAQPIGVATSLQRRGAGCVDSNTNTADFNAVSPALFPRTSSTAPFSCVDFDAGFEPDATPRDATAPDAELVDSGTISAGRDASIPDTGTSSIADAGVVLDAGPNDAGTRSEIVGIVISQVYGGGGNVGAAATHDFVELFNASTQPLSLAGLSIQYGSAAGNFANPTSSGDPGTGMTVLPDVTVEPGRYFLIRMATSGEEGREVSEFDFEGPSNMSSSNGKVALARVQHTLGCGATPCSRTDVVDMVGYGNASDYEGAGPTPALSASRSAYRLNGGCIDTDQNAGDFTLEAPLPRSSATPAVDCSAPPVDAGFPDAAAQDARPGDTGRVDLGVPDAAIPDTGAVDATPVDSGRPDSGALDAMVLVDAAGAKDASASPVEDEGGCSCRETEGQESLAPGGLLVLLGALFARRRRRS